MKDQEILQAIAAYSSLAEQAGLPMEEDARREMLLGLAAQAGLSGEDSDKGAMEEALRLNLSLIHI